MPANTVSDPSLLTNAQTPQTLQAWNNLLESVFGTPATTTNGSSAGTSNTSSITGSSTQTSSDANDPIKALLAMLIPGATGGVANPQNQALIQNLLTQFKEGAGGLSGIQAAGNSAGVYNSSTQGLLANDAMSRAIAAAAGTIGTQQNQQQNIIAQLLATLSAGSRSSTQTSGTSTAGVTTGQTAQTTSKGGSLSGSAGNALKAAAGAALAAKAIKDATGASPLKEGQGRQDDQDDTSAMNRGIGGEGRSDSSDDISGITAPIDPQENSDLGAIDNQNALDDSGVTFEDPFGVRGYDIGDFTANDSSGPNFDFMDFSVPDNPLGTDDTVAPPDTFGGDVGSSGDGLGDPGDSVDFGDGGEE